MQKTHELQCEYKPKLFLFDTFDVDATPVKIYLFHKKKSIKQYCIDTEMPFEEGLKKVNEP